LKIQGWRCRDVGRHWLHHWSSLSLDKKRELVEKICPINNVMWLEFLASKNYMYNIKGMLVSALKTKWQDLLYFFRCFITSKGRYGFVFIYHIHMLMVFLSFKLNLHYFLHKSLSKMAKFYKRLCKKLKQSLFHHSLIWIMVKHHLVKYGDASDTFLLRNRIDKSHIMDQ